MEGLTDQRVQAVDLRLVPANEGIDMQTVVVVADDDLGRLGLASGDSVCLETIAGRTAYAFIGPTGGDAEVGTIEVGSMLRRGLRARTHSTIAVSRTEIREAEEVALTPWIDTTFFQGLHAHLEKHLAATHVVASLGMLVYAPLPDSAAGSWYTVASVQPNSVGFVGAGTRIRFEKDSHTVERAMAPGFDDIGGLDQTITLVRELVELPLLHPHIYHHLGISASRGIIFHGPPGTGKTHLARAMANALKARFFYVDGPSLVGSFHGETEGNLRRLFHDAANEAPSVILFDEMDAIVPRRDRAGTFSDTRMVTQVLALMDGLQGIDQVVVIGTTNRVDAIDPAARRPGRFDREVYFPPPGRADRLEILQIHTRDMPLTLEAEAYLSSIADSTDGFVGSDILELARQSGLHALRSAVGPVDPRRRLDPKALEQHMVGLAVRPEDLDAALRSVTPSLLRETPVEVPETRWEDVGGLAGVKETLRQYVEVPLRDRSDLSDVPRGIVLYGPPGTGKTMLVKALASAANANLVILEGVKVFSRWLGESEDAVHHIFSTARHVAPSIVFIEQLDALAPERQPGEGARAGERVVAQLQVELDGLARLDDVFVVAETNRLDAVDRAILRAGRLGIHLAVDLPTRDEREEITVLISQRLKLDKRIGTEILTKLADITDGFSGADLAQVLREIALIGASSDRVSIESLLSSAVDRRRRSLVDSLRNPYSYEQPGRVG